MGVKTEIAKLKAERLSDVIDILENVSVAPREKIEQAIKVVDEAQQVTDRKEKECCSSGTMKRFLAGKRVAKKSAIDRA